LISHDPGEKMMERMDRRFVSEGGKERGRTMDHGQHGGIKEREERRDGKVRVRDKVLVGRIGGEEKTADGSRIRSGREIMEVIADHQDAARINTPRVANVHDPISARLAQVIAVFAREDGVETRHLESALSRLALEKTEKVLDAGLVVARDDRDRETQTALDVHEHLETSLLQLEVPASLLFDLLDDPVRLLLLPFVFDLFQVLEDVDALGDAESVAAIVVSML